MAAPNAHLMQEHWLVPSTNASRHLFVGRGNCLHVLAQNDWKLAENDGISRARQGCGQCNVAVPLVVVAALDEMTLPWTMVPNVTFVGDWKMQPTSNVRCDASAVGANMKELDVQWIGIPRLRMGQAAPIHSQRVKSRPECLGWLSSVWCQHGVVVVVVVVVV
jgi:hypothetical protein